eukprot:CAMPEP_0194260698 /NCGR_PEP_ID=MMETSP0158-20130606/45643_1 /TAXON_ID=33649 /ORGANISM="Thalassionema nitzschioides, Strain L26-B" /LENGTH=1122 /DNA_ID=CAMNT_0039000795 /DNA_START=12 /DNA_END=3380 /DNA_ORIENTATION=+
MTRDIETATRKELQILAKKHGIKANQKNSLLRNQLRKFLTTQEDTPDGEIKESDHDRVSKGTDLIPESEADISEQDHESNEEEIHVADLPEDSEICGSSPSKNIIDSNRSNGSNTNHEENDLQDNMMIDEPQGQEDSEFVENCSGGGDVIEQGEQQGHTERGHETNIIESSQSNTADIKEESSIELAMNENDAQEEDIVNMAQNDISEEVLIESGFGDVQEGCIRVGGEEALFVDNFPKQDQMSHSSTPENMIESAMSATRTANASLEEGENNNVICDMLTDEQPVQAQVGDGEEETQFTESQESTVALLHMTEEEEEEEEKVDDNVESRVLVHQGIVQENGTASENGSDEATEDEKETTTKEEEIDEEDEGDSNIEIYEAVDREEKEEEGEEEEKVDDTVESRVLVHQGIVQENGTATENESDKDEKETTTKEEAIKISAGVERAPSSSFTEMEETKVASALSPEEDNNAQGQIEVEVNTPDEVATDVEFRYAVDTVDAIDTNGTVETDDTVEKEISQHGFITEETDTDKEFDSALSGKEELVGRGGIVESKDELVPVSEESENHNNSTAALSSDQNNNVEDNIKMEIDEEDEGDSNIEIYEAVDREEKEEEEEKVDDTVESRVLVHQGIVQENETATENGSDEAAETTEDEKEVTTKEEAIKISAGVERAPSSSFTEMEETKVASALSPEELVGREDFIESKDVVVPVSEESENHNNSSTALSSDQNNNMENNIEMEIDKEDEGDSNIEIYEAVDREDKEEVEEKVDNNVESRVLVHQGIVQENGTANENESDNVAEAVEDEKEVTTKEEATKIAAGVEPAPSSSFTEMEETNVASEVDDMSGGFDIDDQEHSDSVGEGAIFVETSSSNGGIPYISSVRSDTDKKEMENKPEVESGAMSLLEGQIQELNESVVSTMIKSVHKQTKALKASRKENTKVARKNNRVPAWKDAARDFRRKPSLIPKPTEKRIPVPSVQNKIKSATSESLCSSSPAWKVASRDFRNKRKTKVAAPAEKRVPLNAISNSASNVTSNLSNAAPPLWKAAALDFRSRGSNALGTRGPLQTTPSNQLPRKKSNIAKRHMKLSKRSEDHIQKFVSRQNMGREKAAEQARVEKFANTVRD